MEWEIKIVSQNDVNVHFQIYHNGKLDYDDEHFSKNELIELITEGNCDV